MRTEIIFYQSCVLGIFLAVSDKRWLVEGVMNVMGPAPYLTGQTH